MGRDPNAPTRPLTAYIRFCNQHRDAVQQETGDYKKTIAELAKRWNKAPASTKNKLKAAFEKESVVYKKKVEKYRKSANYQKYRDGMKQKAVNKARKALTKAGPTRPGTAYNLFVKDHYAKGGRNLDGKSVAAVSKQCAAAWKTLSAAKKQKYQDQSSKAMATWKKKAEAFRQTEEYAKAKDKVDTLTGAKKRKAEAAKERKRAATARAKAQAAKRKATAAKKRAAAAAKKKAAAAKKKAAAAKKKLASKKKKAAAAKKKAAAAKKKAALKKKKAAKRASKKRRATKKRRK